MDDDHVDGNALAGVLAEALGSDMTTVELRCGHCGLLSALASHRVYRAAGWVARCPGCDSVALMIGELDGTITLRWTGTIMLPRAGGAA